MNRLWSVAFVVCISTLFCALGAPENYLKADKETECPVPSVSSKGIRLKFRGAPIESVLEHLSAAAGFTIVLEAQPKGNVDLWSDSPLTFTEAYDLLNSVLHQHGYAALRDGYTLTIIDLDQAKTRSIPVRLGNDPDQIPRTDEMVTQIIPVRFTEVSHLIKDIQPLVSASTTITANESANALVVTGTQATIHRLARAIQFIDAGAEDLTLVKVFHLRNADPSETADLLSSLFGAQTQPASLNSQAAFPMGGVPGLGGFPGGPPGFGGVGPDGATDIAGTGQNNQGRHLKKQATVTAVADARTASLVVSASRDLMPQVERVVAELEANPAGKQRMAVYKLKNMQSQQLVKVLQDLFEKNGVTSGRVSSTTTQSDPLENRSTTQLQSQTQQNPQAGTGSRSGGGGGAGGLAGGLNGGGGP